MAMLSEVRFFWHNSGVTLELQMLNNDIIIDRLDYIHTSLSVPGYALVPYNNGCL